MRSLFLALLLLFGTFPAEAQHNIFIGIAPHAAVAPSTCPFGTGTADNGCSGSQPLQAGSGAVLISNARATPSTNGVNALTGTPTDYSVNAPARNQVGMDYPGGSYTPLASMLDPSNPANLPSGCTYNATGTNILTPAVTCTPTSSPLTFAHFDMTIGGTTCVVLLIAGNGTGLMTVTDNYWLNNGKCVFNNVSDNQMLSVKTDRTTSPTLFTFNTLDANKFNFPFPTGPCAIGNTNCFATTAFYVQGAVTMKYNAFIGFVGRPLQYGASDPSVNFDYEYNVLIGCCSENGAAHNEFVEVLTNQSGGAGGATYKGNTFLVTTFHQNAGEAAIPIGLDGGFGIGPTAFLDIEDNFESDSVAGGGNTNTIPHYDGSVTGGTFTSAHITGGNLGSGSLLSCGTVTGAGGELTFIPVYNATYGNTVSAGAGGGGNSNTTVSGNQVASYDMTWNTAHITAGLDNGSGSPGTIMTVATDISINLAVGYTVAFGGAFGTRTIQSIISGGPTTGTYQMSGTTPASVLSPTSGLNVTPVNIFPGGWTVPGTLNCLNQTPIGGPVSWGRPWALIQGHLIGALTNIGNYLDMWPSGNTPLSVVGTDINGAAGPSFTGVISGTSLTEHGLINSTSVTGGGSGYSVPPSVSYGAGCTTTPVGTAVLGSGGTAGQVVSITQNTPGADCTSAPTVTLTGSNTTPASASSNLTYPNIANFGIIAQTGIPAGTYLNAGPAPNFTLSANLGALGLKSMVASSAFCEVPATWSGSDPNVDMAGINGSTVMNSFGASAITGNGCGP